ncbi:glutaredoxin [Alkalilimnicola ehrlichii]|uniref:Glutaredoxin n=1 Tax=Alkalilimnicola ehrlichii TaxID=351052 RepID=A0A3E0WZF0_9GAMM|nr:glutathione S-transferase N-terminal domain-containing protein [Alkalilimnicola ehrlichii]RFA30041.1 glutaredoxin [Alkalilimnicola ehrlichii]RFA37385.1 glutaredoxin [Alkalilimnicola ehrlichii]
MSNNAPHPAPEQLALYQSDYCPFCVQVRIAMQELGLELEIRDTTRQPEHRRELIAGGGRGTVPCLRIDHTDGDTEWMYESADIIDYLRTHFG